MELRTVKGGTEEPGSVRGSAGVMASEEDVREGAGPTGRAWWKGASSHAPLPLERMLGGAVPPLQ